MRVTICIGSACHLKGSREIIKRLQKLVAERGISEGGLKRRFLHRQLCKRRLRDHR